MTILVINLTRDADRLTHMSEQLEQIKLQFTRVPAQLGTENFPKEFSSYFPEIKQNKDGPLTSGEIGCYTSHLSAMKTILNSSSDCGIIMEDDCNINISLATLLDNIELLPDNWEIIRLSNPAKCKTFKETHIENVGDIVTYWRIPNNMGAYLINKSGAAKFLNYSKARFRAIDEDMRRPWEHKIKIYGISPAPVECNIFEKSSIQDISGGRELPARARFKSPKWAFFRMLQFRLREFGVSGIIRSHIFGFTRSFRKRFL